MGGFSFSSLFATAFMGLYVSFAVYNLHGLMYPLSRLDLSAFPENGFVRPLWQEATPMHMKVYLSGKPAFDQSFVLADFHGEYELEQEDGSEDESDSDGDGLSTILLWKQDITAASLSKSFLLSTLDCAAGQAKDDDASSCGENDPSYQSAKRLLDETEAELHGHDGSIISTISAAGQGIESTSILLTFYQSISKSISDALVAAGLRSEPKESDGGASSPMLQRSVVHLPSDSPIWKALSTNSTVYIHVLVTKPFDNVASVSGATNPQESLELLSKASRSQSLMLGQVDMVKHEPPHHIRQPGRILYNDVVYLFRKHILRNVADTEHAPWDMKYAKPDFHEAFEMSQTMKSEGAGYPYWKPEVAVKYLLDSDAYPYEYAHVSGMELVRTAKSKSHPTGIAHMPALHVDEIGLTTEKYIPVNDTLTSLPLRISFDRSDIEDKDASAKAQTATAGGISPARWRLLSHLSKGIESQKELGFEQSDIDDLRRLVADTNVTLLAITMLASALHLLFEFLTFKSEVNFWRNNDDLTGLSVRSLFLDMVGQVIIVLFLIDKESSLLMIVPSIFGCLIALWKCHRAAGFALIKVTNDDGDGMTKVSWWNIIPRMFGYELQASRLMVPKKEQLDPSNSGSDGGGSDGGSVKPDGKQPSAPTSRDLHELTLESDRIATNTLGRVLLPLIFVYTIYSLIMEEHVGWYSWLITSASSAVYALGFVLMTPQLFLNYKLKSVAHLPWRVLIYKSLNTFIDDLFSFIIRMPTMARISCFRDDIVFFIYIYQRWLYPVDTSRPVEGLGEDAPADANSESAKTVSRDKKQQ